MSNSVKANSWLSHFQLAYTLTGAPPVIEWEVVADGEEIEFGMPVTKATNEVSEAVATSGALYGVALSAGIAGDEIMVAVGDRNNVFVGEADAKTDTLTFPMECDIIKDGTKGFLVDIGASEEGVCNVLGKVVDDDDTDTDDPGRVYFQIKRSQWDSIVAAR